MKKMFMMLLCFGLLSAVAGCGKKSESANNETGAESAAVAPAAKPESKPAGNIVKGAGKAAEYFNMLAGGNYHIKARLIAEDGAKMDMETFAKGDNIATTMSGGGETGRMVIKGKKLHIIMDSSKMIMVSESKEAPSNNFQTDGMTYTGTGSAVFDGKTLPYEEYTNKEGDKTQFFFDGSKLAGIRSLVKDGPKVDMIVLVFDKNIPANVFDIPTGYQTFGN